MDPVFEFLKLLLCCDVALSSLGDEQDSTNSRSSKMFSANCRGSCSGGELSFCEMSFRETSFCEWSFCERVFGELNGRRSVIAVQSDVTAADFVCNLRQ